MFQYEVVIIIPNTCNRPSIEITYEVADAINSLVYENKSAKNDVKHCCNISKKGWMDWNKDGALYIEFSVTEPGVVKGVIDEVLTVFQTSRWQQDTEKMVDNFDAKNLKRVKGTSGKRLIYRATEYVDETSSESEN